MREGRRAALANKTGTVIWMASHCETRGRREDYVRLLQESINVDVQGHCGNKDLLACWQNHYGISDAKCYQMINQKYKFYLAFENVLCKDYGNLEYVYLNPFLKHIKILEFTFEIPLLIQDSYYPTNAYLYYIYK